MHQSKICGQAMRVVVFAVLILLIALGIGPAHAEKRVALVVGNNRYANLSDREQLQKAVSDAQAVGRALREIKFDDVIVGENLGRQAFVDKLDELTGKLSPGDTAFFFFSGHGVVLDGVNYVLPADVPDVAAGQITRLKGAALAEDYITSELLRSGARVAVVVLDACRNNPFARGGTKGPGAEKGLQPRDPPSGVFTLYAAGRNEAALDRLYDGDRDPNGVFTRALLPALRRPGLDLTGIAIDVKEQVTRLASSVRHEQHPAYYDGTSGGRIYLAGLPPVNNGGGAVTPQPGPTADQVVWGYLKDSKDPEKIARFIEDFPLSPLRRDAERLRASLLAPVNRPQPDDPCAGPVTVSFSSRCAAPLAAAQERALKQRDSFRECEKCPEMVVVPAGSFTMGSPESEKEREKDEGPQHRVTFNRPFAVGKFAVTFKEWDACAADGGCNGYRPNDEGWGRGRQPVINVSWDDAKNYVAWLSRKTGKTYRLLSEAEREYVTRADTNTPFWWGGSISTQQANYDGNYTYGGYGGPKGEYRQSALPVDSFQANSWGLYQVHGNVWEWAEDCYHDSYRGAPTDGSAWTSGDCSSRIVRGGSWVNFPGVLRAAYRIRSSTVNRSNNFSFRVGRTLPGLPAGNDARPGPVPGPATDPAAQAAQAWAEVKNSTSIPALEAFIRSYPDGFYADLARVRINELKPPQTAVVVPPVTPVMPSSDPTATTPSGVAPATPAIEDTTRPEDFGVDAQGRPTYRGWPQVWPVERGNLPVDESGGMCWWHGSCRGPTPRMSRRPREEPRFRRRGS
jgi:formylglycine-generating enzyme required for sulfatase activity